MSVMSPLERVRARAGALEALGLGPHADASAIRAAWRKLAFEHHPDRKSGSDTDFQRAQAAFEYLVPSGSQPLPSTKDTGAGAPQREGCSKLPRPKLVKRMDDLTPETIAACREALARHVDTAATMGAANIGEATPSPDGGTERALSSKDHIAASVSRVGRGVTFLVGDPLRKGINRVALPTNVIETRRGTAPRVMSFFSHDSGPGVVAIPDSVAQELFPGARKVRIRFVGGQIERPVTEMRAG